MNLKERLEEAIEAISIRSMNAENSADVINLTQAALNITNALNVLKNSKD